MSVLLPASEAEAEAIIGEAAAARAPLAIEGGGTRPTGRPVQAERTIATRALSGITLYEPAEMVIAARAGTPLAEVEAALAANRQRLAFEPMDHRPLLGTAGEPTIGGVAAANVSGPRRIHSGAARDSLIGIRFVNGRGETVKSGGRVMKNVTGLDLVKFLAGARGSLGLLTEVTFKVLPEAETETTLVIAGLDAERGVAALSAALGTPWEVTGAAHLPAEPGDVSHTVMRLEGFAPSVAYRRERLAAALAAFGPAELLEGEDSRALWAAIRDVRLLAAPPGKAVWRLSVPPMEGPAVGRRLEAALGSRLLYDWGGGLIWASADETGDAGAAAMRAAAAAAGGHATLVRAGPATRAAVAAFTPDPAPLAALARQVKTVFDPAGIFPAVFDAA
ncbi:FAD-binding protein [Prosthecomicrobium pneumaticum]|uniref:Glycolate oxidase FAD binding subunit n=1 Tax=Prosthecomicrobium pneumaticum TaxID=81895 RepID=A0A7W9CV09_9HYPH|nr:glycolate oxidase FAD binding subunit [Prosthecomicrobium pneumaticum]